MGFPDFGTPANALEYSAVKLFLRSAHRIRPDFELAADNLKYVARFCKLAGGDRITISWSLCKAKLDLLHSDKTN